MGGEEEKMDVNVTQSAREPGWHNFAVRVINMTDGDSQSVELHLHIDLHSHQHVIIAQASRSILVTQTCVHIF